MAAALDERLRDALAGYPEIAAAYLFGSRAGGQARAGSDVDVAVVFADSVDRVTRFRLRCLLSERLPTVTGAPRADVVDLEASSSLLAHEVLRRGRLVLSRDEPRRVHVVARQTMRYLDAGPMRRIRDDATFRRLREGTLGRLP